VTRLQFEREPARGQRWAAAPVTERKGACMLEQPPAADLLGLCVATGGDTPQMRCRARAWLQFLARRLGHCARDMRARRQPKQRQLSWRGATTH